MDEKSVIDETIDICVERLGWTKDELRRRFKRTRPVRMEPISDDELIQRYDATTPEQWMELMTTHDPAVVEQYKNEIETLKRRRGYA